MTTYDAFISYSHAGDGRLAPRLQSGLERFARPVWKRRVLRVFRDETGLSASPHLWSSIAAALDESQWFILLASPESAASEWVGREIEHWVAHRNVDRMLVVITDGTFVWDESAGDIDLARSTAAHPALSGVLSAEPRHIDFTWARAEVNLDRRDGRFQDALAELAAPLRGVPKDEIAGEDVRQHRRAVRLARSVAVGLAALALVAVIAGVLAIGQRNEAQAQRARAEVQRAEADAQRLAAEQERERANAEALTATARGASAAATAQTTVALDRALLLGAAGVQIESTDDTMFGLLSALDAASGLAAFHIEPGAVEGVDVAPSGDQVATVDSSGHVRLWSFPDFELLVELELGSEVTPYFLEYVAAGELILVHADDALYEIDATVFEQGGSDPIVGRWAPDAGDDVLTIGVISRDGSLVATAGFLTSSVQVVDTATGEVVSTVEAPPECFGLRGVELDEVAQRLAMICDNLVAVTDLDGGAVLASVGRFGAVGVLFSPDRTLLAVSFIDGGVELLDAATLELVERLTPAGTRVYGMDFSESGDVLVTGSDTGELTVYALYRGETEADVPGVGSGRWEAQEVYSAAGLDGGVFGVAVLPDVAQQSIFGSTFVAGGPFGVTTWDLSARPAMATARYATGPGQFGFTAVDPVRREVYRAAENDSWSSADGRFDVITIDEQVADSVARTIDLEGSDVELLDIDGQNGLLVAFGVDGNPADKVVAAGASPPPRFVVQIADVLTGEARQVIDLGDTELIPDGLAADVESRPFVNAELSPDGTKLLVIVGERSAVWEVATGALLSTGPSLGWIYSWAPDSTGFVVGTLLGQLERYSSDFELLAMVDIGDGFTVSDVDTVPAIDEVIVTVESGDVLLVDPDSLQTVGAPFRASGVQLQQSTVDSSGELLASVDRDGRLRLWRVASRSPVGPDVFVASSGLSSAGVEFSGDDLVVETPGASVAIMALDPASLVERACELASRELTADEWRRYVGEMEQVPCR